MARRRLDPCSRNAKKGDKILGSIIGTSLKLITSSTKKNSNSGCLLLLIVIILLSIFASSCSNSTPIPDTPEQTEDPSKQLNESDIAGVWVVSSFYSDSGLWKTMPSNLYFLSITESGFYSFCFNNHLMGSGKYTLEKGTITLNNYYSFASDKFEISLNKNELYIEGNITTFLQDQKENIKLKLKKTDESISTSVAGTKREPQMYGINKYYDDLKMIVSYLTNYNAQYEYSGTQKSTGKRKILKSYSWYYVYRSPYTYTQEIDGDGNIIIYNFDDKSPSGYLTDNIVNQPF